MKVNSLIILLRYYVTYFKCYLVYHRHYKAFLGILLAASVILSPRVFGGQTILSKFNSTVNGADKKKFECLINEYKYLIKSWTPFEVDDEMFFEEIAESCKEPNAYRSYYR
ncbi:hypothetical protein HDE_09688 [Halotydeus destructor]|nr:hypothetical protein HDE_09688 [Halotydeus destructor]